MRARGAGVTILLFAAALALAWAAVTLLTGGFTLETPRLSSRDPIRPLAVAIVCLAVAFAVGGRAGIGDRLRALGFDARRRPGRLAALACACVFVFAVAWSSRAAGGSDSSCYVLQAEAFAHGQAALSNPLAELLPDLPPAVFAPTGFLPSPSRLGDAVPICGPGLSLIMAIAYRVRPGAVFLVVPVCAALLVWLTFVYGRQLDGPVTGVCAAVLLASSPIFLYQAVQPMSDVPAAAAWLGALVCATAARRRGWLAAGACAGLAILARPNLALPILPLLFLPKRGQSPFWKWGQVQLSPAEKGDSPLFLAAGAAPAVAILLALNAARYGAPWASGYGNTGVLFSLAHVAPNLSRYPRWLLETQTPFIALALAAPWAVDPARRRMTAVSLACVALIVATYLAYTVFDDWWYIRFLLPALPVLVACATAVLRRVALRVASGARVRTALLTAAVLAVAACQVRVAASRSVTDLQTLERRFLLTAAFARTQPEDAVFLAAVETGAIRYHGRRPSLAWDTLPPDALDRTVAALRRAGRPVFIVIEDAEEGGFRVRFAGQRAGRLVERPAAETPPPNRVRIYAVP